MRVIHISDCETFRIVEQVDSYYDFENLCGDTFNPKVNPDIPAETLLENFADFQELVNREGVFGYVLERWNPLPNKGWEHVDSCWGFVGAYTESEQTFNHYIVDEMLQTIKQAA